MKLNLFNNPLLNGKHTNLVSLVKGIRNRFNDSSKGLMYISILFFVLLQSTAGAQEFKPRVTDKDYVKSSPTEYDDYMLGRNSPIVPNQKEYKKLFDKNVINQNEVLEQGLNFDSLNEDDKLNLIFHLNSRGNLTNYPSLDRGDVIRDNYSKIIQFSIKTIKSGCNNLFAIIESYNNLSYALSNDYLWQKSNGGYLNHNSLNLLVNSNIDYTVKGFYDKNSATISDFNDIYNSNKKVAESDALFFSLYTNEKILTRARYDSLVDICPKHNNFRRIYLDMTYLQQEGVDDIAIATNLFRNLNIESYQIKSLFRSTSFSRRIL
jgi:hypothetical protein